MTCQEVFTLIYSLLLLGVILPMSLVFFGVLFIFLIKLFRLVAATVMPPSPFLVKERDYLLKCEFSTVL